MKRLLSLALCLLLLLGAAGCGSQPEAPDPAEPAPQSSSQPEPEPAQPLQPVQPVEPVAPAEPPEYEPELLAPAGEPLTWQPDWQVDRTCETTLTTLCDERYQGRATGSAGNRLAAEWLAGQMEDLGLQPPFEDGYFYPYPDEIVEILPGEAALVAVDGTRTPLEVGVDWVFSPSWEPVEGVFSLSTDIALCDSGEAIFDAQQGRQDSTYRYLQLKVGDVEGNVGARVFAQGWASRVYVTQEVYDRLASGEVRLALKLPAAASKGAADNVCGLLPGTDRQRAILFSSHLDGSGACGALLPGACDNASGVSVMMQTAAWLAQAHQLPCDILFAAFNGEENGKGGSEAFVSWITEQYSSLQVVNIDCVGVADEPVAVYGVGSGALLRVQLSETLGWYGVDEWYSGDQASFTHYDIPAVTVTQPVTLTNDWVDILHSTRDKPENLSPALLDQIALDLCRWVCAPARPAF